mgnify:CR=1 FL=1
MDSRLVLVWTRPCLGLLVSFQFHWMDSLALCRRLSGLAVLCVFQFHWMDSYISLLASLPAVVRGSSEVYLAFNSIEWIHSATTQLAYVVLPAVFQFHWMDSEARVQTLRRKPGQPAFQFHWMDSYVLKLRLGGSPPHVQLSIPLNGFCTATVAQQVLHVRERPAFQFHWMDSPFTRPTYRGRREFTEELSIPLNGFSVFLSFSS